ncbi:hypothetical protein [Actinokineospora globicatena]|uniref:hypothetical protein n=1 Tax=Actinokineospora globicatena TaxID=103729 RepID=UPI0020A519E8|nr:hypothetical protein [Actinokineospora globicatena]MCP2300871.1 hypothetical protein [Actinokineospora globicatena]GLW77504.1 hypothetical protein Aglo01_19860 [Actinokineospora globicatena]GLW84338.1 hypothetical protein Aglo02_19780 [Actinokineospora globicatena]
MPEGNDQRPTGRNISDQFMIGDRLVGAPATGAPTTGSGGYFRFDSLVVLDSLIAQWTSVLDRITACNSQLQQAIDIVEQPAQDPASGSQTDAARRSFTRAVDHNLGMRDYARDYIRKLTATRQAYAAAESVNAASLRSRES